MITDLCNSWLSTPQKHFGYFNHIFSLSEAHQCDQEMVPSSCSSSWNQLRNLVTLASLLFQKTYLATFLVFLTAAMQPRNSPGAYVQDQRNDKLHQKCWFIGFLKGDTNLTKEGTFLHSVKILSTPHVCHVTQKECNWGESKRFYSEVHYKRRCTTTPWLVCFGIVSSNWGMSAEGRKYDQVNQHSLLRFSHGSLKSSTTHLIAFRFLKHKIL